MAASASPTERIYYDGDCGVCHWAVKLVAHSDRRGEAFRFAPLGGEIFCRHVPPDVARDLPDSLVVQTADGRVLLRSDGLIHILRRLGLAERLLALILMVVPRPIRNFFYDRFAANRHRLTARPDGTCPMVPPELRQRFDP